MADTTCGTQMPPVRRIHDSNCGRRSRDSQLAGEVLKPVTVLQPQTRRSLELAARHPGPIHLLLTDLSMPPWMAGNCTVG
jgi:hypothetical protein